MTLDESFEQFWKVKPRRKGSNPKQMALKSFSRAIVQGATAEQIISAAREWAQLERENGKLDTEYVAMASTWLNQKRYADYAPRSANDFKWHDVVAARHGYVWNGEKYVKTLAGQ